jgi:hypothetical protein
VASDRPEGSYSIRDLPPDVRKKVLDRWRYDLWDDNDAQFLTETFQEILEERGMASPKVYWSLSSCQGDGVAWEGSLDLEAFFKWVFSGEKLAKPYVRAAKRFVILQDVLSVRVVHESRYYHAHSMHLEIETTGSPIDLVPERYREDVRSHAHTRDMVLEEWRIKKGSIEWDRNAPIREWEEKMRDRSRIMKRGPKEWRPNVGPKPAPLDIPFPAQPEIQMPVRYLRMIERAEVLFNEIDPLINEFEEFLKEWIVDTSRYLEKIGTDEIDYRQTDEYVIEFLENNEYTFDEDGEEL